MQQETLDLFGTAKEELPVITKTTALFPYFGGKLKVAPTVWEYFGKVRNYVEPFAGSLGVFFSAPYSCTATLNDFNGLIINLWRAIQRDHESVAYEASLLNGEADMHACELQCKNAAEELKRRLEAEVEYFDAKLAGRYLYGLCNKIGPFATEGGPWFNINGRLTHKKELSGDAQGKGISRELPHLGSAGTGISRKLPHLGSAGPGISRPLKEKCRYEYILELMQAYVARLEHSRLTCGDWKRVACSHSVTVAHGETAVYLDPPYEIGDYYASGNDVIREVVDWCAENSNTDKLRIILSSYDAEWIDKALVQDKGWRCIEWKQSGGYGGAKNSNRERLFISPRCKII